MISFAPPDQYFIMIILSIQQSWKNFTVNTSMATNQFYYYHFIKLVLSYPLFTYPSINLSDFYVFHDLWTPVHLPLINPVIYIVT